jgi:hypothetical protein
MNATFHPALPLLLLVLPGCVLVSGPAQTLLPLDVELPAKGTVRLVLIGDTGTFDDDGQPDTCEESDGNKVISVEMLQEMALSIQAEQADAAIALGDLYYVAGPTCPEGPLPDDIVDTLDQKVGDYLGNLGAPTLLVLGNHDVRQSGQGAERAERCFLKYADQHPNLIMPERNYLVDFGLAYLAVIDTNRLPEPALSMQIAQRLDERKLGRESTWTLVAGHHTLKTYHDKENQNVVRPWLDEYGILPDLYANGHAHFLQFGVYGPTHWEIPAATSGSGAKVRCRPECGAGAGTCEPGQYFGRSEFGYAVVDLTESVMRVTYKDLYGAPLWAWERSHDDPLGVELSLDLKSPPASPR